MRHEQRSQTHVSVRFLGLATIAIAVALDQLTKALALASNLAHDPITATPFFNLVLVHNRGMTFGALAGTGTPWWVLSAIAMAIVAVLLRWLWQETSRIASVALGLIIGGAIGNVLDRWRHGAVTDFLDFHVEQWHWPAFNLADVAIFCGVAMLIAHGFFVRPARPHTP